MREKLVISVKDRVGYRALARVSYSASWEVVRYSVSWAASDRVWWRVRIRVEGAL